MQEVYRAAASVLLLRHAPPDVKRRQGISWQILLVHKPRKRDAWQLPQGGSEEGETIEETALRELREETGIEGAKVLGVSKEVYQYDFPPSYRRFRPDHVKGQKIAFIFAMAPTEFAVTLDEKEVNKHVWVSDQQLHLYLKRKQYLELVQRLAEEAVQML